MSTFERRTVCYGLLAIGLAVGRMAVGAPVYSQMNTPGLGYVDIEVLAADPLAAGYSRIVFQLQPNKAYISNVDPVTGDWLDPAFEGREFLVDTGLLNISASLKGPHFGLGGGAWKIYYNKGPAGSATIWQATPTFSNGGQTVAFAGARTQLTNGAPIIPVDNYDRINPLASQSLALSEIRVLFVSPAIQPEWNGIGYIKTTSPSTDYIVETPSITQQNSFRWVKDDIYAITTVNGGTDDGQIRRTDTGSNTPTTLTNDAGLKYDPQGWHDTNFSLSTYKENLVLLGSTNGVAGVKRKLTQYRPPRISPNETYWKSNKILDPLADSRILAGEADKVFQSPEPLFYNGKSYVMATVKNADLPLTLVDRAEIWMWNLTEWTGSPQTCNPVRVSDAAETGFYIASEGEFFASPQLAPGEMIIYYNRLPLGTTLFDLIRVNDFVLPGSHGGTVPCNPVL